MPLVLMDLQCNSYIPIEDVACLEVTTMRVNKCPYDIVQKMTFLELRDFFV